VLDSDLPQALDVLTDLVRNPVLRRATWSSSAT